MLSLHVFNRICGILLLTVVSLSAATYHIDPASGDIGNDGSAGMPWNTLEDVFKNKTFSAGDTVLLYDGYHGAPVANGVYDSPVLFTAAPGTHPVMKTLYMGTCRNLVFRGLTITRESADPYSTGNIVSLGSGATFITVEACSVYSFSGTPDWTGNEWDAKVSTGISVAGANNIVRGNFIKNVKFGMMVGTAAESTMVDGNHISWYTWDGIRALGNYCTYQHNRFTENVATQPNHDANAILSWSTGAGGAGSDTVKGCIVRGNLVIDYFEPDHPFKENTQCMGIGLYDGMFQHWVIENNVICVDMWHGISIYGGIDCRIVNNTVVDMNTTNPGPPWIRIDNHKNGTPSSGCIVRNNISNKFTYIGTVTNDHNFTIPNVLPYYNLYFTDYAGFDFTLKPSATAAIDAGSSDLAPATDYAGTVRPEGSGVDLGAYEYVAGAVILPAAVSEPVGMTAGVYFTAAGKRIHGVPQQAGVYFRYDGSGLAKVLVVE